MILTKAFKFQFFILTFFFLIKYSGSRTFAPLHRKLRFLNVLYFAVIIEVLNDLSNSVSSLIDLEDMSNLDHFLDTFSTPRNIVFELLSFCWFFFFKPMHYLQIFNQYIISKVYQVFN